MRRYLVVLLVLIGFGLCLGYLSIRDNNRLDSVVYVETSESIKNLKLLSNDVDMLLLSSRIESNLNHEKLSNAIFAVSEEFDNLRFDALFEEIEANPQLSKAVQQFDDSLRARQELIELFIPGNEQLKDIQNRLPALGLRIEQELNQEQASQTLSLIHGSNMAVFRFLLAPEKFEANYLNTIIPELKLASSRLNEGLSDRVADYAVLIGSLLQNSEQVSTLLERLNAQTVTENLDQISSAYGAYHEELIGKSNSLTNAWGLYGLVLLVALVFFAIQLRKLFLGLEQNVEQRTKEIVATMADLKESQEQLIQSEKMASLGGLAAGMAHEINTPLGYISSNVDTLDRNFSEIDNLFAHISRAYQEVKSPNRDKKLVSKHLSNLMYSYGSQQSGEFLEESRILLSDSSHGLQEISKLVTGLKDFVRLDRQDTENVDLHDCLENAMRISKNILDKHNVVAEREFSDIPKLTCSPSKLNQVFLNLITNAAQSMSERGGVLRIRSATVDDNIQISFIDQGVGMNDDTKQKMFDPFFTTKPVGQGTGLGLSIAYKIVQAHGGSIEVESSQGRGSNITLIFPIVRRQISEAA